MQVFRFARLHRFPVLFAAVVLVCGLVMPVTALAEERPNPEDAKALVQETTEQLLAILREQAEEGDIDVDFLQSKVDEMVKPHLDFPTMTRLAVGRHWRNATDEQKIALVDEFRTLITRTYSAALEQVEDYDGQRIEFLPLREGDRDDRVQVRSVVVQPDGPDIPVNYGLRYTGGEWKLYDVIVDGISLVTTYRSGFGTLVSREGIDGLIEDLRKKNERGEAEVPEIDAG